MRFIILLIAVGFLGGCSTSGVTSQAEATAKTTSQETVGLLSKLEKLKAGMSLTQVEEILGQKGQIILGESPINLSSYMWEENQRFVKVDFQDGKLLKVNSKSRVTRE
ncbi:MAG: hypothetical protein EOP06_08980 [Proteobacteria bacterium]|nr:MAG: hypothetical protein EOP06_08980 [Pseudomonadota bacterium]